MDLFVPYNQEENQKSSLMVKKYLYFLVYADYSNPSSDFLINGFKIHFIINI